MLAEILAIYAAVVSTASLVISYFSDRSNNPRLVGQAMASLSPVGEYRLRVELFNRGRGPVTVKSIYLNGSGKYKMMGDTLNLMNPNLPARIEGHAAGEWDCASEIVERLLTDPDISKLEMEVLLGDAKILRFKVIRLWV
jgi:hypothetical protein